MEKPPQQEQNEHVFDYEIDKSLGELKEYYDLIDDSISEDPEFEDVEYAVTEQAKVGLDRKAAAENIDKFVRIMKLAWVKRANKLHKEKNA